MAVFLNLSSIESTPYIQSSFTPPRHKHSHEFFELSFCVSGKAVNTINDHPIPFQNGTCVILRPGDVHSLTEYDKRTYEHIDIYATDESFRTLCNALHKDLYEEIMSEESAIYFPLSNELFQFLFNQSLLLKEMIANKDKFFEALYSSIISVLLSEWIKNRVYIKKYMPTWLSALLPKFNDVSFIQKNITQIAGECGFSLPYFSTQFKKHVGVSAIEYLTKKRVHLSKDLIAKNTHLRILDISGMLGFENPSTFSKHFLQEFKLTPKEYRKRYQNNYEK